MLEHILNTDANYNLPDASMDTNDDVYALSATDKNWRRLLVPIFKIAGFLPYLLSDKFEGTLLT